MDTDGNGYICKREMVNAYKQLGCTEAEAKEMAKVSVHAVQECILVQLCKFEEKNSGQTPILFGVCTLNWI